MSLSPEFRPATDHETLGEAFFDRVRPATFPQTRVRYRNQAWAARIGLGGLDDAEWQAHFGRFAPLPGSLEQPLALRYHGHQFGSYNPDLGDGRGFLYAQLRDPPTGRLLDLGTKGSGRTPWSRSGDGRLTLNGGIREVLATSLLEAIGVETSKSLSLIETGEDLERGDEPSPTRSAVLVRLNHSHVRIGTFQRLLYLEETDNIGRLLDYSVETYWPQARRETRAARAAAFLACVGTAVARLGAQWMAAGFVHGVLNTDNINITGESFDYGPWRFLPHYDPSFTAAYFDHTSRYAYGRQPSVLAWNMARLAEALLPLCPQADLEGRAGEFRTRLPGGVPPGNAASPGPRPGRRPGRGRCRGRGVLGVSRPEPGPLRAGVLRSLRRTGGPRSPHPQPLRGALRAGRVPAPRIRPRGRCAGSGSAARSSLLAAHGALHPSA